MSEWQRSLIEFLVFFWPGLIFITAMFIWARSEAVCLVIFVALVILWMNGCRACFDAGICR